LAQEIEISTLKEQNPLSISGSISTNQIINTKWDTTGRETLYNDYYSGNLNIDIYGVSVPLSFTYSNRETNFTHPFNQIGIHPSYKWVKTHIGYSSLSFSPYTLNGYLFLGAALELTPPKGISAKVMYGTLKRAVEPDSTEIYAQPAFKRTGYGIKLGAGNTQNHLDVNLFVAGDKENSLTNPGNLAPEQNSAMSVSFSAKPIKNLNVNGELAGSYITTDTRRQKSELNRTLRNIPGWFLPINETTVNHGALKANISYNRPIFSVGMGYERVDPDYRTFGTYYFTNNLENITVNGSLGLFKNSVSLSGNAGIQKEAPESSGITSNSRFVGSANLTVRAGESLNMNMSFSNFTSYTNIRSDFDYINETDLFTNYDTLGYRQVSTSTTFTGNYRIKSGEKSDQSVSLNLLWQGSNEENGVDTLSKTGFYNAGASYRLSLKPIGLSVSAAINLNQNETSVGSTRTIGPTIGANKMFWAERLKTSLSFSYNTTDRDGVKTTTAMNTRLNIGFSIRKQHNFNISALLRNSNNNGLKQKTMNITAGYVWMIGVKTNN